MFEEIPLIEIQLTWPHERFGLCYTYLQPSGDADYHSSEFVLGFVTITWNHI